MKIGGDDIQDVCGIGIDGNLFASVFPPLQIPVLKHGLDDAGADLGGLFWSAGF